MRDMLPPNERISPGGDKFDNLAKGSAVRGARLEALKNQVSQDVASPTKQDVKGAIKVISGEEADELNALKGPIPNSRFKKFVPPIGLAAAATSAIFGVDCGPRAGVVEPTTPPAEVQKTPTSVEKRYEALLPVVPGGDGTPTSNATEASTAPTSTSVPQTEAPFSSPTAKPKSEPTPTPVPPTATERPLSTATPTPTELPKTPTKVPIPEDNISKETAQFVEWSPQKVDQTLHEAWEKGEFKTVINWDVNKKGWELKKIPNHYDPIHGSSLVLFLPEGETFTFYAMRTGEIYDAGPGSILSAVEVKAEGHRVQQVFPLNGEVLVKTNQTIKVGDQIFRLCFVPDSPEQKKFETKVAKEAVVYTAFPDKTVKGNYRYLQLEHLLTDEQGRLVVLNPDLGAK